MTQQNYPLDDGELIYLPGFLDNDNASQLLQQLSSEIAWRQDQITVYGKTFDTPRLQAFQGEPGLHYQYSRLTLTSTAWHPAIAALLPTLAQHCTTPFNCALLNLYRHGNDTMGWHSDDEPELGLNPVIASLSLGQSRRFLLRHKQFAKEKKQELVLHHGDLLIMSGSTQHYWQHSIPRTRKPLSARINLTFRHIKQSK